MSRPIEPTPIITGKSAKKFLEDFDRTNELMKNLVYRKEIEDNLDRCHRLYLKFMSRMKK
jgi:hypothetical protein